MKSNRALQIGFLIACLPIAGCLSKQPWQISEINNQILKVEIGMTKQQVIGLLGKPNSREVIPNKNGTPIEYLLYQTRFTHTDSPNFFAATDAEMTPFVFTEGKLTGWGRNYYDRIQKQDITIHEDNGH